MGEYIPDRHNRAETPLKRKDGDREDHSRSHRPRKMEVTPTE